MSGKRIYELTEKSNLENDYFMALDKSGTANAQKVNVSKILNPINNISGSADEYSSTKAYAVGDLVIHDNKLYKCTTACSAAAWSTNQGYFTQSTLTTELTNVKSSLNFNKLGTITMVSTDLQSSFCSQLATLLSEKTGLFFTTGPFEFVGEVVNGTYKGNYQRMSGTDYTVDYATNNSYYRTTIPNGATVTVQNLYSVATGAPRSIDVYFKS